MHYSDFSCYKLASGVQLLRFWCQLYGLPRQNWKAQSTPCGTEYMKTSTKTCVASKTCSRNHGVACAPKKALPDRLLRFSLSEIPVRVPPQTPLLRFLATRANETWGLESSPESTTQIFPVRNSRPPASPDSVTQILAKFSYPDVARRAPWGSVSVAMLPSWKACAVTGIKR